MFFSCYKLKELNISNFNINDTTNITSMFEKCPYEFKNKAKEQNNCILI